MSVFIEEEDFVCVRVVISTVYALFFDSMNNG